MADLLFARSSRGVRTTICKVAAHVGVRGNELADAGAAAAVGAARGDGSFQYTVPAPNESVLHLLPSWLVVSDPPNTADAPPHVDGDGLPYILSNITSAARRALDVRVHSAGCSQPTQFTLAREAFMAQALPVSNAMWDARGLSSRAVLLAMRARFGTLNCPALAARQRRPYLSAGACAGCCLLCGAGLPAAVRPRGSVGHLFGACAHPMLKGQYIERHNEAVRMLYRVVAHGDHGGSMLCVAMDAGPAGDLPAGVLGTRLPAWLLPDCSLPALTDGPLPLPPSEVRAKLRPDLLFIDGPLTSSHYSGAGSSPPAGIRRQCTVYVIEVGFISESSCDAAGYTSALARKTEQHSRLCDALRAAGWRVHGGAPLVLLVGHFGTVFQPWQPALRAMGVPRAAASLFLRRLHMHSLACAVKLEGTRVRLERSGVG